MRTALLLVALVASGCASINKSGGAGGGSVTTGEARTEASETGAATNSVATNGSESPDPAPQHPGPPANQ
jgi:uncharacterized protein YceK